MPNWCNNNLYIYHSDSSMIERAVKAWNRGKFLHEFIPVPAELIETTAGFFGDEEKQKELAKKQQDNLDKYGYANWYDFCVEEWGTKWDIGKREYEEELILDNANSFYVSFESAWSPPVNAYAKLESMGFEIKAYYYEPGVGFCGAYMHSEDSEFSTQDLGKIPLAIRNVFGLDDNEDEEEMDPVDDIEE